MNPEQVIIIGTGRLPCSCLEACLARSVPVAGCIESGSQGFSPLAALCRKRGVEYQLTLDRKSLSQYFLSIRRHTLVVSAYNYFIFPREVLENPALNVINFHNSLLPRHRGRNAPTWSIYEMDEITGITWHQVHPTVDAGDVIVQKSIAIDGNVTALNLTLQTLDVAAAVFTEILPSLLSQTYTCTPVRNDGNGSYHRSTEVPNGGVFDPAWTIKQAYAFLRALDYGKFKVFAAPKLHFSGADWSITGYQIRPANSGSLEGAAVAFQDRQLRLRDREAELLISCD